LATIHGRGVLQGMELAATEDDKLLGIRAKLIADMGAYFQLIGPGIPMLGAWLYGGCYRADAYWFEYTGVFTNQTPTDAYRGAGRPEATYAIERAMDALARKVGKDPAEIRRLNFIPPFSEPTALASGLQADSGDYEATLARALDLVGHEAAWSQIVADALGVPYEDVEVLHGDTAVSPLGMDTYGSRSVAVGGVALMQAADKVIDKARKLAAHELEVAEADLDYESGRF